LSTVIFFRFLNYSFLPVVCFFFFPFYLSLAHS
jgi:hypothetical protein